MEKQEVFSEKEKEVTVEKSKKVQKSETVDKITVIQISGDAEEVQPNKIDERQIRNS